MTGKDRYPAERLAAPSGAWATRYVHLAEQLLSALGPEWELEHVGSTSVPGLVAKPVVDLALRAPEGQATATATARLMQAGWTEPEPIGDHWATFLLVDGVRSAIGHLFTAEQWPQAHVRLFAQWLRTHPEDRDRYAELKRSLVADGVWGGAYTEAKGAFVLGIVNRARADQGSTGWLGRSSHLATSVRKRLLQRPGSNRASALDRCHGGESAGVRHLR